MAKRSVKAAAARARKKQSKLEAMRRKERGEQASRHPSKYAAKNRKKEIAAGFSTRPTSPFYLPESMRTAA